MDFFNQQDRERRELKKLLSRSYPAQLGVGEREVMVLKENISRKKKVLERGGFYAIGRAFNGRKRIPVWFIRGSSL